MVDSIDAERRHAPDAMYVADRNAQFGALPSVRVGVRQTIDVMRGKIAVYLEFGGIDGYMINAVTTRVGRQRGVDGQIVSPDAGRYDLTSETRGSNQ